MIVKSFLVSCPAFAKTIRVQNGRIVHADGPLKPFNRGRLTQLQQWLRVQHPLATITDVGRTSANKDTTNVG